MAYTIPNEASAGHPSQAGVDSVDLDILNAKSMRSGVVSGCGVTAQGTPDMTVAVAAGLIIVNGALVTVAAGNVTIAAADTTNARFDLIAVDNTGAKSRVAGTASSNPVFPAIPANSIILAAVRVAANDASIVANRIVDKGVRITPHGLILNTKASDTQVVNTVTETVVFTTTIPGGLLAANDILRMHVGGNLLQNTAGTITMHPARVGFGATVLTSTGQGLAQNANRQRFGGWIDMLVVSTTAQRFSMNIGVAQATVSNPFAPHSFVFCGQGDTTEDTSTSKALEWRVKMDTAGASTEILAKQGWVQLLRPTG